MTPPPPLPERLRGAHRFNLVCLCLNSILFGAALVSDHRWMCLIAAMGIGINVTALQLVRKTAEMIRRHDAEKSRTDRC